MLFRNTTKQFGWISIGLHWIMTLLILGMLALGLYMTRIPISLLKLKLYGIHKEFGMLILFLFIIRLSCD
jgi:cytochrome b561